MSMKRILGMMLASRMAGRGSRGGLGGLGGLAAGGLIGGGRGGLGKKAGLAALGYMAYRAYQDHQARSASGVAGGPNRSGGDGGFSGRSGETVGLSGALGGIVKSVTDALGGAQDTRTDPAASAGTEADIRPEPAFAPEAKRAAETFSEDTALLLVRAMVTAANADGAISSEERFRIMAHLDAAGDAEDRRSLEHELANPRPLEELLGQVRDKETAEEFYLASRMAIDPETEAHRAYLSRLRDRLGLGADEAAEIAGLAS